MLSFFSNHAPFSSSLSLPVFVGLKLSSELRPESGAFNRHKEERAVAQILYVSRDSICSVRRTQFTPTPPPHLLLNRIFLFHFPTNKQMGITFATRTSASAARANDAAAGKCFDDKSRRKRFCSATMLPTTHLSPTLGSCSPGILYLFFL